MAATAQDVARAISRRRFRFANEIELQDSLEKIFKIDSIPHAREVTLGSGDIIDFLVDDSIGVEVKIDGSTTEVTRQLHRYAGHERVRSLILVSSRMRLRNMPAELSGKPLLPVELLGSLL